MSSRLLLAIQHAFDSTIAVHSAHCDVLSLTATSSSPGLVVAKSGLPSPLKSPAATPYEIWPLAVAVGPASIGASKWPSPIPSSTLPVPDPKLAVTTSGTPSRLKSATAIEYGLVIGPVDDTIACRNVPSPRPSSTLTSLLPR